MCERIRIGVYSLIPGKKINKKMQLSHLVVKLFFSLVFTIRLYCPLMVKEYTHKVSEHQAMTLKLF